MAFQPDIELLDDVEAIARAGADQLLPHFRHLTPDLIAEKARNDLVTVADRASEAAILRRVSKS